jgi:hypothetical protein
MDTELSHSVVFELPDVVEADAFSLGVGVSILDTIRPGAGIWLVSVKLAPAASHLALVLRRAEAWLAASGLGGIWYHLDGRPYLLQAPPSGLGALEREQVLQRFPPTDHAGATVTD